jgi:hypothetical protein
MSSILIENNNNYIEYKSNSFKHYYLRAKANLVYSQQGSLKFSLLLPIFIAQR